MPPSRIFFAVATAAAAAAATASATASAAVARLMNAPCKYYFCLCTRQLSATLALINNAKQSAGATVGDRMVDAGVARFGDATL